MLKIILAEDHNIVRNGIKMLLESQPGVNVIAEATNGNEVLDLIRSNIDAGVVLTDINMPGMEGITLIRELKALKPEIKIIILSMMDGEKYIAQAFNEGASGYLLKNIGKDELIFGIIQVSKGERYLCNELSMRLLDKFILNTSRQSLTGNVKIDLSMREMEILHLTAEGLTNNEMADKLFLSKRTVEGHRQALIDKTGAKNTAALIRFALVNGFIQ